MTFNSSEIRYCFCLALFTLIFAICMYESVYATQTAHNVLCMFQCCGVEYYSSSRPRADHTKLIRRPHVARIRCPLSLSARRKVYLTHACSRIRRNLCAHFTRTRADCIRTPATKKKTPPLSTCLPNFQQNKSTKTLLKPPDKLYK